MDQEGGGGLRRGGGRCGFGGSGGFEQGLHAADALIDGVEMDAEFEVSALETGKCTGDIAGGGWGGIGGGRLLWGGGWLAVCWGAEGDSRLRGELEVGWGAEGDARLWGGLEVCWGVSVDAGALVGGWLSGYVHLARSTGLWLAVGCGRGDGVGVSGGGGGGRCLGVFALAIFGLGIFAGIFGLRIFGLKLFSSGLWGGSCGGSGRGCAGLGADELMDVFGDLSGGEDGARVVAGPTADAGEEAAEEVELLGELAGVFGGGRAADGQDDDVEGIGEEDAAALEGADNLDEVGAEAGVLGEAKGEVGEVLPAAGRAAVEAADGADLFGFLVDFEHGSQFRSTAVEARGERGSRLLEVRCGGRRSRQASGRGKTLFCAWGPGRCVSR